MTIELFLPSAAINTLFAASIIIGQNDEYFSVAAFLVAVGAGFWPLVIVLGPPQKVIRDRFLKNLQLTFVSIFVWAIHLYILNSRTRLGILRSTVAEGCLIPWIATVLFVPAALIIVEWFPLKHRLSP